MLVDATLQKSDPAVLAELGIENDPYETERVGIGLYLNHIHRLQFEVEADWEDYADLSGLGLFKSYGVCDSPEQFDAVLGRMLDNDRASYVVGFTPIFRKHQPPHDGWRWEKWGPYIGTREQTADYLADEKDIDLVFCFHIYRKIDNETAS